MPDPTWCDGGNHISEPVTISLTAREDGRSLLQIAAAVTAGGEPGVYVATFDVASERRCGVFATPDEAEDVAAALLAQAAIARKRWG